MRSRAIARRRLFFYALRAFRLQVIFLSHDHENVTGA